MLLVGGLDLHLNPWFFEPPVQNTKPGSNPPSRARSGRSQEDGGADGRGQRQCRRGSSQSEPWILIRKKCHALSFRPFEGIPLGGGGPRKGGALLSKEM